MTALFRNYRAEPNTLGRETLDVARKRVLGVVKDSKSSYFYRCEIQIVYQWNRLEDDEL